MPSDSRDGRQPQSSTSTSPRIKRTRASKPKVKTGCITCKIRRIKCDEGKPSCRRCTSTGRKCDGYAVVPDRRSTRALTHARRRGNTLSHASSPTSTTDSSLSLVSSSASSASSSSASSNTTPIDISFMTTFFSSSQGTLNERRAIEFFQNYTVPTFSGYFESGFWKNLVLRASYVEPAIRQAVIAFGTLHHGYQYSGWADTSIVKWRQDPTYLFALQHYGQAIGLLNERISEPGTNTVEVALIFCALCLCFEIMHGNSLEALLHLQSGLRMLKRQGLSLGLIGPPPLDPDANISDDYCTLYEVFCHFDNHASSFVTERPTQLYMPITRLAKFNSIDQARDELERLTSAMYVFNRSMACGWRYRVPEAIPPRIKAKQAQLLRQFSEWADKLDELLTTTNTSLDTRSLKGAMLLKMQHRVGYMTLVWCLSPEEGSTAKRFENIFEEIVSYGEALLQTAENDSLPKSTFKGYTGVNWPLYFTASRCRNHDIRHRAVRALGSSTREGTWNGPLMAKVVSAAIDIEEEGMVPGEEIPESKLLHEFNVNFAEEQQGRLIVSCVRTSDPTYKVWEEFQRVIPVDAKDQLQMTESDDSPDSPTESPLYRDCLETGIGVEAVAHTTIVGGVMRIECDLNMGNPVTQQTLEII